MPWMAFVTQASGTPSLRSCDVFMLFLKAKGSPFTGADALYRIRRLVHEDARRVIRLAGRRDQSRLTTRSARPFSPRKMLSLPAAAIFSRTSSARSRMRVGLTDADDFRLEPMFGTGGAKPFRVTRPPLDGRHQRCFHSKETPVGVEPTGCGFAGRRHAV